MRIPPFIMDNKGNVGPAKVLVMPKAAIVINLDDLDRLAKEYLVEMGGDGTNDITERLTLSSFIQWLRNKQSESDNEINARR